MTISEKVAHLKGLMEGLNYPADTAEGKILYAITDILSDLALEVDDLEASTEQLHDYVEELDEDLGDVEEYLFVTDEDEVEDEDADESYEASELDLDPLEFDDGDDENDDEDVYALECPSCGETIYLTDSLLDETDILCPACHESISFTIEEEDSDESDDGEKPVYNDQCSD